MSISKYTFLVGAMTSILAASTAAADDVAASVAARLRDSGQLEDYRVNVKESEGTVFLEGEVTDARQIAAALAVAENTDGVERVVNRLSLKSVKKRSGIALGLPASMRALFGSEAEEPVLTAATGEPAQPQFVAAGEEVSSPLAMPASVNARFGEIELVKADDRPKIEPAVEAAVTALPAEAAPAEAVAEAVAASASEAAPAAVAAQPSRPAATVGAEAAGAEDPVQAPAAQEALAGVASQAPAVAQPQPLAVQAPAAAAAAPKSNTPRPMAVARASAIPTQPDATRTEQAATKKPSSLSSWVKQVAGVIGGERVVPGSERVVPGSERVISGYGSGESVPSVAAQGDYYVDQGYNGGGAPQQVPGYVPQGGGLGRPMPMGAAGVGMPPVPMRGDGPNMPNYAWPSYASYPNYAALQYPTQYSPTAWPYIGPFYPYPQVPLGWRRVSLEWDDGWWFLDFDDRPQHH